MKLRLRDLAPDPTVFLLSLFSYCSPPARLEQEIMTSYIPNDWQALGYVEVTSHWGKYLTCKQVLKSCLEKSWLYGSENKIIIIIFFTSYLRVKDKNAASSTFFSEV